MNPEHLKILRQDREGLRKWRFDNLGRKLDLSSAYLLGVNLYQTSFHQGDLHEAHLSGALLSRANLNLADLGNANLVSANL